MCVLIRTYIYEQARNPEGSEKLVLGNCPKSLAGCGGFSFIAEEPLHPQEL